MPKPPVPHEAPDKIKHRHGADDANHKMYEHSTTEQAADAEIARQCLRRCGDDGAR